MKGRHTYTLRLSALVLLLLCVVVSIDPAVDRLHRYLSKHTTAATLLHNADRDLYQSRLALASLVFSHDVLINQAAEGEMLSNAKQAYDGMIQFQALTQDRPEITSTLESFEHTFSNWSTENQTIITLLKTGQTSQAETVFLGSNEVNFTSLRGLYDHSEALISDEIPSNK
ncbi:MCP four helix bundle domain-containing protein [Marinomonas profundimaris]|uniref:Chemotaxis methyl-accepting receptor HlyB-like 4HB MCP domain-containing protein n=1 Tax=Marinomonas profundimaris TaxID=1208321 RepID=W1S194_9GAMM|nr:MCP four helix bundle domain-containing protein [Marinomonas profundimaris]ETI60848.1 hypothetical protein D104_08575 [Marinomonas profundimaris]